MKMEILLESTSNKLMVGDLCDSFLNQTLGQLERNDRFYTSAGNPVKQILLKLNLPDHRKLKDGGEVKEFQRSFCHSDTERLSQSDEVLKLKNFKKDATLKLFKSTNQERVLHRVFAKVNHVFVVAHDGNVVESYVVVDERHVSPLLLVDNAFLALVVIWLRSWICKRGLFLQNKMSNNIPRGASWKRAQRQTLNMISGLLAVRMSTPVFVDPESSTQADEAQSSRVPVSLSETPMRPLAPPISLFESTPPVLVPILRRTAHMAVRVPHAMSSYESSPSVSPPDLPSWKHYWGTSELVEDSEEDDDEEDEEIEESMDSDSVSEDAEDEGPTAEDEDPTARDEGLTAGVEGPSMDDESYGLDDESHGIDDESYGLDDESHGIDDESYGLDDERHGMDDESHGLDDEGHGVESDGLGLEEEEEAVPGGQQQAALVVGTAMSASLGLGYGALRRRELALEEDHVYNTFEVGQGSGSAPESERPERVSASR
ncbi:hypothetical protein Tco_0072288 [Tanacetum coccineum]